MSHLFELFVGAGLLALFFRAVVEIVYAGQRPVDDPDPYRMSPTWKGLDR